MKGSFRFIHCADLHLGSRFVGISTDDEALGKKMRASTFKALDKIVSTAKKEKVDFVIFSGDIFDSSNETPLTRSLFSDALEKIKVPCYIAYGNHDYMRKWESSIPFPENAFVFPDKVTRVMFPNEEEPLAEIFGISYSTQHVEKDLTEGMAGDEENFSIGILHCDLDTVSENNKYAPCKLSSLLSRNIDYWALGHIHKGAIVNEIPYVVYPGNTQGRNIKESGEKGAYLVTVTNSIVTSMDFFRTCDILWTTVEADITGVENMKDLVKKIADDIEKGSMIKVTLTGHGDLDAIIRLDPRGVTELIEARTGCNVTELDLQTLPEIDIEARRETGDFVSAVINYGTRLETEKRDIIIDMICSTTTSENFRSKYEAMSDEELSSIARDAMLLVVEKILGANKQ